MHWKWGSLILTFKVVWPFWPNKGHSTSLLYTDLGLPKGVTRSKRALVYHCYVLSVSSSDLFHHTIGFKTRLYWLIWSYLIMQSRKTLSNSLSKLWHFSLHSFRRLAIIIVSTLSEKQKSLLCQLVVSGGIAWCHQWRQSWHYNNSSFSVLFYPPSTSYLVS